ncbi:DNA mismatch repair protein MutS [Maribacter confluentis]|uniref:DNA mismatch repair protein MutS n=2 Tax=Maribacter confluentis TaxID=1656093 RepID=A0ABT8RTG0_9FLAO|nr:Smr/MutS family protein [Maribacter confluentis]MDO1514188.1 DNA mismatch repair protein MutS [Maribacter confluentis]
MSQFQIGDIVETIDDVIKGRVNAINGKDITIISDDGFPLVYEPHELVLMANDIRVSNFDIARIKKEKEIPKRKKSTIVKPKERNAPKMEVDLHINQLVKNPKQLDNYAILNLQLETAKRQLDFAIAKRIQKIVFIHGVGEGILKEELRYLFNKYGNIKYYDAEYQKYGLGATEVYVYQNP